MKKLFTFSIICLISGLILSSCNSKLFVSKRHYNDGYYISYNKGKQALHAPKENAKANQNETSIPVLYAENNSEDNSIYEYVGPNPLADNKIIFANNEKSQLKEIQKRGSTSTLKNKAKIIEEPISQIKNTLFKTSGTNGVTAVNDDGLSFLWVVIVVLLVLWALGYIAGFSLGGLINILLVIALILLILWLLRVL